MSRSVVLRHIVLGASHLVAGVTGVVLVVVLWGREVRGRSVPMSALGLAWMASTDHSGCKPDLVPWARSLVAHRAELQDDDFAVEAAATLTVLRDHGVACEGVKFESGVARRCSEGLVGPTPMRHASRQDAGADASAAHAVPE